MCAISSWVALWSTRNSVGSPVSRTRKNTTVTTPQTTKTAWRQPPEQEGPHRGSLAQGDPAEVHVQLGERRELQHARRCA